MALDTKVIALYIDFENIEIGLQRQYKTKFKIELKRELGLSIKCILKDYDPGAELAATVIVLEENSFIK